MNKTKVPEQDLLFNLSMQFINLAEVTIGMRTLLKAQRRSYCISILDKLEQLTKWIRDYQTILFPEDNDRNTKIRSSKQKQSNWLCRYKASKVEDDNKKNSPSPKRREKVVQPTKLQKAKTRR